MISLGRKNRRRSLGALSTAVVASFVLAACGGNNAATDTTTVEETVVATDEVTTEVAPTVEEPVAETIEANEADVGALDAVTVTGATGEEPTIEFTTPFVVTGPVQRLVTPGDGAPLEEGQQITLQGVSYTEDGEKVFSTWELNEPQQFIYGVDQLGQLYLTLQGAHVGAQVLAANPTTIGDEQVTVLSLFEVTAAETIPTRAEGDVLEAPAGMPIITLDENGAPSIEFPEGYEAPTELEVATLIRGDGPAVTADQTLTVQYSGWLLDGTEFDSSWSRGATPASFPLNAVIPGWTQGLTGQNVGSQVLLVIPPDLAYGASGQGPIPGDSTLVFVVDILAAQ